jgi:HD-GYP domain-containing protein (c-di-GMP phosphodiesterase class II)
MNPLPQIGVAASMVFLRAPIDAGIHGENQMRMRVAVVTSTEGETSALTEGLANAGVDAVHVREGTTLPPGTAGILGRPEDRAVVIKASAALGSMQQELLEWIAHAIDSREELEPGSSLRVMDHASRFGKELGLSAEEQFTLERGALLRDIGKLKIPNSVLLKYTLLTHDEWLTIQRHTHIGGDLAKGTQALADIEPIVRWHHECWDGTGYPDGLEGDAIPRLAHIVRIVDVYCAMTGKRHYRKTIATPDEAIQHLRSESGKHFAPDLVEAFLDMGVGNASQTESS